MIWLKLQFIFFVLLAIVAIYLMLYKPLTALCRIVIKYFKNMKKELERDENDR